MAGDQARTPLRQSVVDRYRAAPALRAADEPQRPDGWRPRWSATFVAAALVLLLAFATVVIRVPVAHTAVVTSVRADGLVVLVAPGSEPAAGTPVTVRAGTDPTTPDYRGVIGPQTAGGLLILIAELPAANPGDRLSIITGDRSLLSSLVSS